MARYVTSRRDIKMHGIDVSIPCILAVSSLLNSTARHACLDALDRHVERVASCRDVTSQVEFAHNRLHYINYRISPNSTCCVTSRHSTARYLAQYSFFIASSAMLEQARRSTHDTARHVTSRFARHVVLVVSCRDVTGQVQFWAILSEIPFAY